MKAEKNNRMASRGHIEDKGINPSFSVVHDPGSEWGELLLPRQPKPPNGGLRIVLLGSTTAGHLLLKTLIAMDRKSPGKIDIRAVATDAPLDPKARISVKKRIWRYYSGDEKARLSELMKKAVLSYGIPCYTGGVKNNYFRSLLKAWDPEVIIMCCFGQKIDTLIYEYPALGMYNFHPSDLASNIGAGAEPFMLTIENGRTTSNMILHRVTETIDAGPIVGISPTINIALGNGHYPDSILVLQEKIPSVCGWMTHALVTELLVKKEKGEQDKIDHIDFEKIIPPHIKELLLKPVSNDLNERYELPLP
jgi:folate-dependent phosphoribosylglycinamide formyltransferase PurN